jgi:hypothetical protein
LSGTKPVLVPSAYSGEKHKDKSGV